MDNKNFTSVIDGALTFISSAVLTAALAAYFMSDALSLLAASVTVGVCVTALIRMSQSGKKKAENPEIRKMMQTFIYGGSEKTAEFIVEAFKKRYTVTENDGFFTVNSTAVFIDFKPRKLNNTELAVMFSKTVGLGVKQMTVLTSFGFDKESCEVIKHLPIERVHILDAAKTHAVLSKLDAVFNNSIVLTAPKKRHFKEFVSSALAPERSGGYLFVSFALALSSFIMPYTFYYILFSAFSLALGILTRINIKERLQKRTGGRKKQA